VRWRGGPLLAEQPARLAALVRDFERACARYEQAIQALDERSAELEQQPSAEEVVADAVGDDEASSEHGTAPPGDDRMRLEDAGFDDLRSLGLSVTQAKRILALRDSGALDSTANLESVPGLPARRVAELKRVLRD